jgi:deoxycytidylate deaminase
MKGPCAKQVVTCKIVCSDGQEFVGRNDCDNAQTVCPRAGMKFGEGYDLCFIVCGQQGHAEIQALALAGSLANGGHAEISGHTYCCQNCTNSLMAAGVKSVTIK